MKTQTHGGYSEPEFGEISSQSQIETINVN